MPPGMPAGMPPGMPAGMPAGMGGRLWFPRAVVGGAVEDRT
eukprot:gene4305-1225_t